MFKLKEFAINSVIKCLALIWVIWLVIFPNDIPQISFKDLGGEFSYEKLKDYSGVWESNDPYFTFSPKNLEQAQMIIKYAYSKNIPIRFCGRNHSANGLSLPKKNEFLIKTQNLAFLEFVDENRIRVGAGPNLKYLNEILKTFNLQLPVLNGGPAGPSVGGFISAGGLGNTSNEEGGFWENVFEITIVIKNGEVLKINREDELFPWIFGSIGQFGLITEAVLKVIPIENGGGKKIPFGKIINLNSKEYLAQWKENGSEKPLYWLNFFGTKEMVDKSRKDLENLRNEFINYFENLDFVGFERDIKYKNFNPPLIFSEGQGFSVQGLWGHLKPNYKSFDLSTLEVKANFFAKKYGHRRYVQTDFNNRPEFFKDNWGENYLKFYSLKKKLDPKFLFGQGLFPAF